MSEAATAREGTRLDSGPGGVPLGLSRAARRLEQPFLPQDVEHTEEKTEVRRSRTVACVLGLLFSLVAAALPVAAQTATIGNRVWYDANANGLQDGGEKGITGASVTLYTGSGGYYDHRYTDTNGNYSFSGIPAGTYYLELGNSVSLSAKDVGGDDAVDNDFDPSTRRTANFTVGAGVNDLTRDCGVTTQPATSVGNRVWFDANGNGVQDAGESGVAGVTVRLWDHYGEYPSVATDANGSFSFPNLLPGSYRFRFVRPTGFFFTRIDQGGSDATDSDADPLGYTAYMDVVAGATNLDVDAGLIPDSVGRASVGNRFWHDADANGIQDAGETGIAGVYVYLQTSTGAWVSSTYSNASGGYAFPNLAPGDYYLETSGFPSGTTLSPKDQGGDDAADSDLDPANRRTAVFNLPPGVVDDSWDVGITNVPASVSGVAWQDLDENGVRDGGEPGLPGTVVSLRGTSHEASLTVTTDANGAYEFAHLVPGSYRVQVYPQSGFMLTALDRGGDDGVDSDIDVFGYSPSIALPAGSSTASVDAGMVTDTGSVSSIVGHIWYDADADGIQDAGERGIGGIYLSLCAPNYGCSTTTHTDQTGSYRFTGRRPGDYYLMTYTTLTGYALSPLDQGSDDAFDSDFDPATRRTNVFTLGPWETKTGQDGGYATPAATASVGNRVWLDTNANGIQDGGEPGIPGVTVSLVGNGFNFRGTTVTDTEGTYRFDNVFPGSYRFYVYPPFGHSYTLSNQGADDGADSDVEGTGYTATFTVAVGTTDLNVDSGLISTVAPASVGDRVWLDTDADGVQDEGENGLPGATVRLFKQTNTSPYQFVLIGAKTTGASGDFLFDGLPPDSSYPYQLGFELLADHAFPAANVGSDATDSDADPTTGRTSSFYLGAGQVATNWDAGQVSLVSPGSIGDRVWKDANGNGLQDAGEVGLAGVTVTIRRGAATVASVTTGSTGAFSFGNLIPGSYSIVFGRPAGWTWTLANQGADDAADSDADATGATGAFDLAAGQSDASRDAGFVPVPVTASVGNLVWNDLDGDGIQDGEEPGIAGVTVRLYAQSTGTVVSTTTTTEAGAYSFSGFAGNQSYFLEFVLPSGYAFTIRDAAADTADSDVDVSTGRTADFYIAAGATHSYWDAGMLNASPASLGDKVWLDADGDGQQDGDEPGISGITVRLYKAPSALVSTTTTAAGGLYGFSSLAPGDYVLEVVKPTGYNFSTKDQGGDDALDSDVDTSTGRTAAFTLAGGASDMTRDAGLVSAVLGSIGDRVWVDADADGLQDAGEASQPGVTVRLYTSGGSLVGLTTTGPDGLYRLESLISGSYYLEFVLPAGYAFTAKDAAGDTADSDADPATGRTATFTLAAGESTTDWDAGLVPLAADLSVTKTGPASVSRGAGLAFTVVVANAGPGIAPNVTLTDPTPAGLVFASASAPCSGGFPCTLDTLSAGASQPVTVTYTVPADYAGADPIVNVASVSATTQDPSPADNQATSSIPVDRPPVADLAVTKTGPPSAAQGFTVSWTVVVHNGGTDDAPNVLLADPAPAGLTFHSASSPCAGGFPCNLGTLNAGASKTVTVMHSIPADYVAPDPIQNTASVSSDATDGNAANDSATASTPLGANPADVRVVKSGPAEAAAGTDLTYTIAVSNAGPGPAANVVLDDPTPSGLAIVSADPPCASGFPCSLGTLGSGASVTLTATFSVPSGYTAPNPIVNTATVSSTTADPVPGNNGSSVSSALDTTCGTITGTVSGGGTVCALTPSFVTVTVSGGTPPYTVTLDNGGGTQSGTGPTFYFGVGPTVTTAYAISSLSDSLGCTGVGNGSATLTVAPLAPVSVTPAASQTICATGPGPLLTVTPGCWGPMTAQWGYRTQPGGSITPISGEIGLTYGVDGGDFPGAGAYYVVCTVTPPTGSPVTSNEVPMTLATCRPIPTSLTFRRLAGPSIGAGYDDGPKETAMVSRPRAVAVDDSGNRYLADEGNHTIRKIDAAGHVSTLAGLAGSPGATDGRGGTARFWEPTGVAVSASGDVYVADSNNNLIRRIDPTGNVSTLGMGGGFADGPASTARFYWPNGVAADSLGNVYVADTYNHRIRKIDVANNVTTLAGNGTPGFADGTALTARFYYPMGVAVDVTGNVYVADVSNQRIRKIDTTGNVTTAAGTGSYGFEDGPGTVARFGDLHGVAVDSAGTIYVADKYNNRIRRIDTTGEVTTLAGDGTYGFTDGPGSSARFAYPQGVAVSATGVLYVADLEGDRIREIDAAGQVSTLVGGGTPGLVDGPSASARFDTPSGAAVDASGNVFVVDRHNNRIRKIDTSGDVTTLAGDGTYGFADGPGMTARFAFPSGISADSSGAVYVADEENARIRRIDASGHVTTVAGDGTFGFADGPASTARFVGPKGVAVHPSGHVYVADATNARIRKIDPSGVVSTLAGNGEYGFVDGPASLSRFRHPRGIAVDVAGNVYVADDGNDAVRKIDTAGTVSTLGYFTDPTGVAVDGEGEVYVTLPDNTVYRVGFGVVAGYRSPGGFEGTETAAGFNLPWGMAVDAFRGKLVVVDRNNHSIRIGEAALPDVATIDAETGRVGVIRQLDTTPQTATTWKWELVRRPTGSTAELSSTTIRNPTFTPDVPDVFVFRLTASDSAGVTSGTIVALTATGSCTPPAAPDAGSNSPVCEGGTVALAASRIEGATYAWTGPNGFTSALQNPTISNATTADAGVYSVTATVDGCVSASGTTTVTVNAAPSPPAAASNSPVAAGETIQLTASTVPGATYAWAGPNGFSSTEQNPTIANATAAMGGVYAVTATAGGCTSLAGTTVVVIPVEHDVVAGQWTWVGGSDEVGGPGSYGVYGTKGVAAPGNGPSARSSSSSWTDASGAKWLFGGAGDNGAGLGLLNDLWRWDGASWTWVSGSSGTNQAGIYGTKGATSPENVPGARDRSAAWTDADGNQWLFGGQGFAGPGSGNLNDLWKWDGTGWTWISGSNIPEQAGSYGTRGVAVPENSPGARYASVAWADASGNLWLFGGAGNASGASSGFLNDLWKWDGTTWTWVSGSDGVNESGAYGTKGVPGSANSPGARLESVAWTDAGGNLWLFGGYGYSASGIGNLNDLWMWDGTSWTWVSGSDSAEDYGVYGTKGIASPGNTPGARRLSVSWTDRSGGLWLFGGLGRAASGLQCSLNDLWRWEGSSWKWMSGSDGCDQTGTYGAQGMAASENSPGARYGAVSWTDASGDLWLLGGTGYDAGGLYGTMNDLWVFGEPEVTPDPATAVVSGSAEVCAGSPTVITATLTGTPPFSLTWSDGFVQSGITAYSATRTVTPTVSTTYTLTSFSDAIGPGAASGAASLAIQPPLTSVSVSPSQNQLVCASGRGALLTVFPGHAGPYSIQWGFRTSPGGSTTPLGMAGGTYEIEGSHFPGTGEYYLVSTVTTSCGSVRASNEVRVTVVDCPPIPTDLTWTHLVGSTGGAGRDDGDAATATLFGPQGVVLDPAGNRYVADTRNHTIRKVDPAGNVTTVAGLGGSHGSADGRGAAARFNGPRGIAIDASGNLYVADEYNNRIRKVDPSGNVTTLAGSGTAGYGDGPATAAQFWQPLDVAVDAEGNVLVADTVNDRIRQIDPNGFVTTVAGTGVAGFADGAGTSAQFSSPRGLAIDGSGGVLVADAQNNRIRRIDASRTVTTIAGSGTAGFLDGPVAEALFQGPEEVVAGPEDSVYVADAGNGRVRKILAGGTVETFAGNGVAGFADGPGSTAMFSGRLGLALDAAGKLCVADSGNNRIRAIDESGFVTTIVGSGTSGAADGSGTAARFSSPGGVWVDAAGNVLVADADNNRIRKIDGAGVVTTLAGTGVAGIADGDGAVAQFNSPNALAADAAGNVYVADALNSRIRKIDSSGLVTTVAGSTHGFEDGPGSAAKFARPSGVALDGAGNLWVADRGNWRVRRIDPSGNVTTAAGTGVWGVVDGPGSTAQLGDTMDLAVDGAGNVYVADGMAGRIRKIDSAGTVTTLALVNVPFSVAADAAGNVYATTRGDEGIVRVEAGTGTVTSIGGRGSTDCADGTGKAAGFSSSTGIAVDPFRGALVVADTLNHAIRIGARALPDVATIDSSTGFVGEVRQLDTAPQTATAWKWEIVRRPSSSTAELSSSTVRNPTFTPDVLDVFIFRLTASDAAGVTSGTLVTLSATEGCTPPPAPTAWGDSPVCEGGTISLSVSPIDNAIYAWTGPNGFTSSLQNPTIPDATAAMAGTYGVTVTVNGCTSGAGTTEVAITPGLIDVSATLVTGSATFCLQQDGGTFAAVASGGDANVAHQWGYRTQSRGAITPIAGLTAATCQLLPMHFPGIGTYYLVDSATASCGGTKISNEIPVEVRGCSSGPGRLTFTHFAGSPQGTGWFDGPGTAASFNYPDGIVADPSGNLFVADVENNRIRKVTTSGTVTTLAGSGTSGSADGRRSAASFSRPVGLAIDGAGNLYVSQQGAPRIRKVTPDGLVTTLAGSGVAGSADGTAAEASFNAPAGLAVDASGAVYVADSQNHKIRRISPDGVVTTTAGSGVAGGTDGTGDAATFNRPAGLALDAMGRLVVADSGSHKIRLVTSAGVVTTLAGSGTPGAADGTGAAASFNAPSGVVVSPSGDVFVADFSSNRIRRITPGGAVTTLAGQYLGSQDGTGPAARFRQPRGLAVDGSGNLYVTDMFNSLVRMVTPDGIVTTLAGSGSSGLVEGTGAAAAFNRPEGISIDSSGVAFVADVFNYRIRAVTPAGAVTTFSGDSGAFNRPSDTATDSSGNVYVADQWNHRIRKITPGGVVTTLAGSGTAGNADGSGTAASFKQPYGVAVDGAGNVFVTDQGNHSIRRVTSAGVVTTLAGSGSAGFADGTGPGALFSSPGGLAVDPGGRVFVADKGNHSIRVVTPGGVVTTLAGSGSNGFADGAGPGAGFSSPTDVALVGSQGLLVADTGNRRIREVTSTGVVTTLAGTGRSGSQDGTGSAAWFHTPVAIAVGSAGNVFVTDAGNFAVSVGRPGTADVATIDLAQGVIGDPRHLGVSPGIGLVAVQWKQVRVPTGSTATVSSNSALTPTFTPDIDDTYVFQLTATDAIGQQSITYVTLTAVEGCIPPPMPLAGNDGPVCEGGVLQLSVGYVAGATYAWTGPDGFTSNEMLPTLSGVTPAMAGDYSVTVTVGGCASAAGTTTVVVHPRSVPVIDAPPTVVPNTAFTASVEAQAGSTYAWTVLGGSLLSGNGTSEVTVKATWDDPVTLKVVETNANGCVSEQVTENVAVELPEGSTAFYTLTPCRVVNTRRADFPPGLGAPSIGAVGSVDRTLPLSSGTCGIPSTARAVALNIVVADTLGTGYLTLYPGDAAAPATSTINFKQGQVKANNAFVPLSSDASGTIKIKSGSTGMLNVLIDVVGYFE